RFTFVVGTGPDAESYNVRCLPDGFPGFTFQRFGQPQAAYYLMSPKGYVTLFDTNGVPAWWYEPEGFGIDADLTPGEGVSFEVAQSNVEEFGFPGTVHVEVRGLDGTLLNTLGTLGTPTDLHEALPLPNGDFLIDSYVLDLGAGTALHPNVLDASFQDVRPD